MENYKQIIYIILVVFVLLTVNIIGQVKDCFGHDNFEIKFSD